MPNPLQSANAPQGEADQRVYTPQSIIELLLAVWPEGIGCDPFPGVGAPVTALAERTCQDGFAEPWGDRAFANPPFNRLQKAMLHATANGYGGRLPRPSFDDPLETILLGPAQTHRTWFWELRGQVTGFLKPLAFVGFTSTFPRPLALHYWGRRAEQFRAALDWHGLAVHAIAK